jgi:hypothetical protein
VAYTRGADGTTWAIVMPAAGVRELPAEVDVALPATIAAGARLRIPPEHRRPPADERPFTVRVDGRT